MGTDIADAGLPEEHRTWGMICHLSALAGFVAPLVGSIVGPLVVWLVKRDEIPFVDEQGKEALNFQITLLVGFAICFVLAFVLIGIFLAYALAIYALVMVAIAASKAKRGEHFRYPYCLRLIH